MAKRILLALALHSHQPVGNFPFVFEQSYRQAYLPLVDLLERHPKVRLGLHYSGPLRDWIVDTHPEFIERVGAMAKRGQVEMMTGAYYEPIIAAIPGPDKHGQISKLTSAVASDFGYSATGMWLAERVWEPHIVKPMAEAGVEYTIVDDTHFKYAGLTDRQLMGYFVTEEEGQTLKVFATSKHLRYLIPWKPVEEVIAFLESEATENGTTLAIMGDDGEKFGSWPGTYEWCYEKGWMESFFTALEQNSGWLQITTPGDYARIFPPLGRIYLPTASYAEMMEWALPPEAGMRFVAIRHDLEQEGRQDILDFLKGGFWRNFMVKYPEINNMHKKMLHVHNKVWRIPDGPERAKAQDELWMGQCNCPYWHGVFGGIYYTHIRTANYEHLIKAENIADSLSNDQAWVKISHPDFDCDSLPEVLVESNKLNLYFDPQEGGSLFELDFREKALNLVNTLARRQEGYHQEVLEHALRRSEAGDSSGGEQVRTIHDVIRVKEEGLERFLHYDWYRRVCLLDHFLHPGATLSDFANASYGEAGDFVRQPYTYKTANSDGSVEVTLERHGYVWCEEESLPIYLAKTVRLREDASIFTVDYEVFNSSERPLTSTFGSEANFAMLGPQAEGDYYLIDGEKPAEAAFDSAGSQDGVQRVELVSRLLGIRIQMAWNTPATLWRFPVQTVQSSEGGFERSYQCSAVVPLWNLSLQPGDSWRTSMVWEIEALRQPTSSW